MNGAGQMTRIIIFDVDSTLLAVESLDFAVEQSLSRKPGGKAQAAELAEITSRGWQALWISGNRWNSASPWRRSARARS